MNDIPKNIKLKSSRESLRKKAFFLFLFYA